MSEEITFIGKKAEFLKAYEKQGALTVRACKSIHISPATVTKWKKEDGNFSEAMRVIAENNLDIAEAKLMEQIESGNITAIIFFLKTKGKDRGYVERHDINTMINTNPPSWFTDENKE